MREVSAVRMEKTMTYEKNMKRSKMWYPLKYDSTKQYKDSIQINRANKLESSIHNNLS